MMDGQSDPALCRGLDGVDVLGGTCATGSPSANHFLGCNLIDKYRPGPWRLCDCYLAGRSRTRPDYTTADRLGDGDHCWVIDGLFFSACVWVQCGSIFQRYLDRKPAWLGLASGRVCRFLFRGTPAPTARSGVEVYMSTKRSIAWAAIAFLILVTAIDMAASEAPNPYVQPPVLSWGSGQVASGAMCTSAPRSHNR